MNIYTCYIVEIICLIAGGVTLIITGHEIIGTCLLVMSALTTVNAQSK